MEGRQGWERRKVQSPQGPGPKGKGKSSGKGYQGESWECGKMGHNQYECRAAYYIGECVDDEADIAEVDVGGVWSIGSEHVREFGEDNSHDDSSVRALAWPPRASLALSVRSVGTVGLESGIPRVNSSSSGYCGPCLGPNSWYCGP